MTKVSLKENLHRLEWFRGKDHVNFIRKGIEHGIIEESSKELAESVEAITQLHERNHAWNDYNITDYQKHVDEFHKRGE